MKMVKMVRQLKANHRNNFYTVVGSRKAPPWANLLLTKAVGRLEEKGFIGRSGDCPIGPDTALNLGLKDVRNGEFYVPSVDHNGFSDGSYTIDVSQLSNCDQAMAMAESVHPAWDRCNEWARELHGRNPYQVLGRNLDTPSLFLLTWAPLKGNKTMHVTGGTATAVSIAIRYNVPIWNVSIPSHREHIEKFVDGHPVRLFTKRIMLS